MRALIAALLLGACVAAPAPVPPPPVAFALDGGGIQPAGTPLRIDFGRAQDGVIGTVNRLLGDQLYEIYPEPGCGSGQVVRAQWLQGLALIFEDGDFRGWSLRGVELSLRTGSSVFVGTARSDIPNALITETTRGTEFQSGDISGVLNAGDTHVAEIWSGLTCG